jgi:hypothetical protein
MWGWCSQSGSAQLNRNDDLLFQSSVSLIASSSFLALAELQKPAGVDDHRIRTSNLVKSRNFWRAGALCSLSTSAFWGSPNDHTDGRLIALTRIRVAIFGGPDEDCGLQTCSDQRFGALAKGIRPFKRGPRGQWNLCICAHL